MVSRFVKSLIAALIMAWATYDLSGSIPITVTAAVLPLALGLTNVMPFAAVALPMFALLASLAHHSWNDLGLDHVAAAIYDGAGQVRDRVVATLPQRPE